MAEYDPQIVEQKWQKRWEEQGVFAADADPQRPKYYLLEMLPYPSGHLAHGPHAQLHHRRRRGAVPADARLQRAAPDRLGRFRPARGKRRHQARHSAARMDQREHRANEGGLPALWLQLRLAARNLHLRAGVLPLEPVVFPAHARARAGLSQTEPGELVSEVPNGAGQRTSDRRLLLAARRYASRGQGNRAVVPAHHAVRRRAARRHEGARRRLAGTRAGDAAQLDRQIARHAR